MQQYVCYEAKCLEPEMWPQIQGSLFALSPLQPAGLGRSILLKTETTVWGGTIQEGKRRSLCECYQQETPAHLRKLFLGAAGCRDHKLP